MAGLGSAFGQSYEDGIDRNKRRRSDNMAAFNSFVKMQSELGVDAKPEDLERMKRSLAGGNVYFGQGLPSKNVLNATSERLGAIKADKEVKEQGNVLSNQRIQQQIGTAAYAQNQLEIEDSFGNLKNITGTNSDNDDDWNTLKGESEAVKKAIAEHGEGVVRRYFQAQDRTSTQEAIMSEGLADMTVQSDQVAYVASAPKHQRNTLKRFFKGVNEKAKTAGKISATAKIKESLIATFETATDVNSAIVSLLADGEIVMGNNLTIEGSFKSQMTSLIQREWTKWSASAVGAAAVAAGSDNNSITAASPPEVIASEVLRILKANNVTNPSIEDIATVREALMSPIRATQATDDEAMEAETLVKISAMTQEEAEQLEQKPEDIKREVEKFMAATRIDFTSPRYQNADGTTTRAYDLFKEGVTQALTSRVRRANSVEGSANEISALGAIDTDPELKNFYNPAANREDNVFLRVNVIREMNDLPPFINKTDSDFQKIYKAFEMQAAGFLTVEFNTQSKSYSEAAAQEFEDIKAAQAQMLSTYSSEGNIRYQIMSQLNSQYLVRANQFQGVTMQLEAALDDAGIEEVVGNEQLVSELVRQVALRNGLTGLQNKNGYVLTRKRQMLALANLLKPGTRMTDWYNAEAEEITAAGDIEQGRMTGLPVDAPDFELDQASKNIQETVKDLEELLLVMDEEVGRLEVKSMLDVTGQDPAQLAIDFKIKVRRVIDNLKAAVPAGVPTFLLSSTGEYGVTFSVNSEYDNPSKVEELGFLVGAIYTKDRLSQDPIGYRMVQPPTQDALPQDSFLPDRSNLIKITNGQVRARYKKAFENLDYSPNQKAVLNAMLGNPQVTEWLLNDLSVGKRRKILADPQKWFNELRQDGNQYTHGLFTGDLKIARTEVMERALEAMNDPTTQ